MSFVTSIVYILSFDFEGGLLKTIEVLLGDLFVVVKAC